MADWGGGSEMMPHPGATLMRREDGTVCRSNRAHQRPTVALSIPPLRCSARALRLACCWPLSSTRLDLTWLWEQRCRVAKDRFGLSTSFIHPIPSLEREGVLVSNTAESTAAVRLASTVSVLYLYPSPLPSTPNSAVDGRTRSGTSQCLPPPSSCHRTQTSRQR